MGTLAGLSISTTMDKYKNLSIYQIPCRRLPPPLRSIETSRRVVTMHGRSFHRPEFCSALIAICFLLTLIPLSAEEGENPLNLSLDRDTGVYAEGESARIRIEVEPKIAGENDWHGRVTVSNGWLGEPREMNWEVTHDGYAFDVPDPGPGLVIVNASLHRNGDVDATHRTSIGFLFQPSAIKLSTPDPDDFDAFWNDQQTAWRALPHSVSLNPVETSGDEAEAWDLAIEIDGQMPVSGYLARPKNAASGSLPVILTLHGAGVRSANLSGVEYWARQGFLALDINAHGLPNGKPGEYYRNMTEQLSRYRREGVFAREDWYFRTMFLRIVSAIDFLVSRPEWNGNDLVLYGSSQGGAQVLAGAGLDERVTLAVASVPAMCDLSGYLLGREPGWPKAMPENTASESQWCRINRTFQYYDGGNFARRIQIPLIVSIGMVDRTCPADGIQAAINNARGEVIPIYRPRMGHAFPRDVRLEFLRHIREKLGL